MLNQLPHAMEEGEEAAHPLLHELRGVLHRLKTTPQPVRDGHDHLVPFCETLEMVFRNGLKQPNSWFGLNKQDYWSWIEPLQDYYFNEKQNPLLREVVHAVATSPHLQTLQGRGRCFLRIALCQKLISVPIEHLVKNGRLTTYWYQDSSIVATPSLRKVLMAILFEVTELDFELQVDSSTFLDETWIIPVHLSLKLPPIKTLDLKVGYASDRAIIMEIEEGCLAEKAGVQAGDCLVELCGETVYQANHGKLKQLLVAKSVDTTELVVVKRFLTDGSVFYPILRRQMILESRKSSSPSPTSPSPASPPALQRRPSDLVTTLPTHTEYRVVFLGKEEGLTEAPSQSVINHTISKVLLSPHDPSDLVIRVGQTEVTLLTNNKTAILGEFLYSSLCGCGQGTTHQTCFAIMNAHVTTDQTRFTGFVCEAVSSELANAVCVHIAQGFSRTGWFKKKP